MNERSLGRQPQDPAQRRDRTERPGTEELRAQAQAWVREPRRGPTPPRVSGTTAACSTRLIRSSRSPANSDDS